GGEDILTIKLRQVVLDVRKARSIHAGRGDFRCRAPVAHQLDAQLKVSSAQGTGSQAATLDQDCEEAGVPRMARAIEHWVAESNFGLRGYPRGKRRESVDGESATKAMGEPLRRQAVLLVYGAKMDDHSTSVRNVGFQIETVPYGRGIPTIHGDGIVRRAQGGIRRQRQTRQRRA